MTDNGYSTIEYAGESLTLRSDKTAHWRAQSILFVADTHFGKSAAFRAGGVPVPENTTGTGLERLCRAIDETGAEHLVVLGDFLHAKSGVTRPVLDALDTWIAMRSALRITLVRGNHDRNAGDPPTSWGIEVLDPGAQLGPFTLMHEPPDDDDPGVFMLSGHLHPAVRLVDPATRSGVCLPCFWCRPGCLVLPAFGSFTGTHVVRPRSCDEVRVCAGDAVLAPRA